MPHLASEVVKSRNMNRRRRISAQIEFFGNENDCPNSLTPSSSQWLVAKTLVIEKPLSEKLKNELKILLLKEEM